MRYTIARTVFETVDVEPVQMRAGRDGQPTTDWVTVPDTPMWAMPLSGRYVGAIRLMYTDGSYIEVRNREELGNEPIRERA